jgi:ABC-type cobalamin/Fe3+-siderophores transport system ATPase subunit
MTTSKPQPVLSFDHLTIRFGGLTAVNDFSYEAPQGNISSVIGPNGAGKTTAFNVATGIYAPTSGRVLFMGHEPQRAFTWRIVVAGLLIGLLTGLTVFLLASDIDRLWSTVVKRPMADPTHEFSYARALGDVASYLRGDLFLTFERGRWLVQSPDGVQELDRVAVPTVRGA